MNIKELKEWLKSEADNLVLSQNTDAWIYLRVLSKISSLNESTKVIIPQFAADIIELDCEDVTASPSAIDLIERLTANEFDADLREEEATDRTLEWLKNSKNLKIFIDAFENGYEVKEDVKKGKLYEFLIPTAYQCLYDTGKEVAILPYKYDEAKSAMTMERAKTWTYFNAYNDAGLLHITEAEE